MGKTLDKQLEAAARAEQKGAARKATLAAKAEAASAKDALQHHMRELDVAEARKAFEAWAAAAGKLTDNAPPASAFEDPATLGAKP